MHGRTTEGEILDLCDMDKGKDVSAIMFVKSKGVLLQFFFHGR